MRTIQFNQFANDSHLAQAQSMSQPTNNHMLQPMNQPVSQPISEQEPAPKQINDSYYEHTSGYLFRDKKIIFVVSQTSLSLKLLKS